MKNSTITISHVFNSLLLICSFLIIGLMPTISQSQNYRTIDAYMDDFVKNELFVKKSLMDYSITIVESQMYSRTKTTAVRIIEKLEKINTIMRNSKNGFEGNTMLKDGFIKMNQKTIDCLQNGSLILNDYEYQSSLPLSQISENLNRKENELITYYQELKNFEITKKTFALNNRIHLNGKNRKNILEYNAYQNILFYKMNVIDEKLTAVINAKDKKGFSDCLDVIALMHQEIIIKTNLYKNDYKDTTLNDANVAYSNFIVGQKDKLNDLFNSYADAYNALQQLKNPLHPQTNLNIDAYNNAVKTFNINKNLFYTVFNSIQLNKVKMYNNWLTTNSSFLKNNGQFESIYDRYVYND
ncbi:hypothetical protein [Flavobacterium sp.]|uniref:hypothetical protein n=1 Tax=Flavobacterium sp. TaxID=239 RepID=UPI0025E08764|nr:hypothetical protein [Flavobacterium sp.]